MGINKRFKSVRKNLQLTQFEFAKKLGVNSSYISLIETNRCKPSKRLVAKVVKKYHISEQWIQSSKGTMFSKKAPV